MKQFIKRIFYISFMLLLISIISFVAINLAPNSFLSAGELNPNMSQEAIANLKAIYGLDKPFTQRYFDWLKNIVSLNFGISFVSGASVSDEILKRVGVTLFMNFIAMVGVFVLALYFGIVAAMRESKKSDRWIQGVSLISFAMPSFYLALVLIIVFAVKLPVFPISGLHSLAVDDGGLEYYLDMLWHLVLPILVMVFVGVGSMIIYVRSLTLEILKSDYYFFALSRNIEKKQLVRYYILPNLMPPVVTLLGLSLPGLIGGSVILESMFGIEGMGQLFFMSAMSRDYPVIMGILMITAFLTLLGNMIADLALLKLNPYAR